MNGIRGDKLSREAASVSAHPDKYKKDFSTIVAFLTQYINKRVPTLSVKVSSVGPTRPSKWQKTSTICGTFKGKIEFKKYFREEYDSVSMAQCQQLCELWKIAGFVKSKDSREHQSFRGLSSHTRSKN